MKLSKNIIFLGMMGSGKTSIGQIISKKLKLNFVDIDILIENELDMKVSKIFENKGEIFFRKIEEKLTLDTLKKKNNVIALGGGTFLNNNIRKEILNNHISFWLKWNSNTLIKRIKNSTKRPIAFSSTNAQLIDLIKKRSDIYSKALYKISCDNLTKTEIVKKILYIYETKKINSQNF